MEDATLPPPQDVDRAAKKPRIARVFEKCEACRKKKCKCLPVVRNFRAGERCVSCVRRGLPCGPNERHQSNQDQRLITSSTSTSSHSILPTSHTATHGSVLDTSQSSASKPILPRIPNRNSSEQATFHGRRTGSSDKGSRRPLGCDVPESSPMGFASAGPDPTGAYRSMRANIKSLQGFLELTHYLRNRRAAVEKSAAGLPSTQDCPTAFHLVEVKLYHAEVQATTMFDTCLGNLLNVSSRLRHDKQTECLLTLSDFARRFSSNQLTPNELQQKHATVNKEHLNPRVRIFEKLIWIADKNDKSEETDLLCHDLVKFCDSNALTDKPALQERVERAFRNTSERMSTAYQSLELSPTVTLTPHATCNIFPPAQKAMLSPHRWLTERLSVDDKVGSRGHDILERRELHWAAELSDLDAIRDIVRKHPEQVLKRDVFHSTPLAVAASTGNLDCVKALLDARAELQARDISGRTAFAIAENSGHHHVAAYLVLRGIDPSQGSFSTFSTPVGHTMRGGENHNPNIGFAPAHGLGNDLASWNNQHSYHPDQPMFDEEPFDFGGHAQPQRYTAQTFSEPQAGFSGMCGTEEHGQQKSQQLQCSSNAPTECNSSYPTQPCEYDDTVLNFQDADPDACWTMQN